MINQLAKANIPFVPWDPIWNIALLHKKYKQIHGIGKLYTIHPKKSLLRVHDDGGFQMEKGLMLFSGHLGWKETKIPRAA